MQSIFKEVEILKTFPHIGRILEDINDENVREIFYQNYRIVYHILDDSTIDIVTIQHSSRDLKRHLENN